MTQTKDISLTDKIVINSETSELIVKLKVGGNLWRDSISKAKESISKKRQVPGFREGKAPSFLSAKNIPEQSVYNEAIHSLRNRCESAAALEVVNSKIKEKIVSEPKVVVESLDANGALLTFYFPIFPHFEMPNYKDLGVKIIDTTLSAQDVVVTASNLFGAEFPSPDVEAQEIAFHDLINIDFSIWLLEGKKDESNTGNIDITIGSGMLIPSVEEKLLGMKKGDEEVFEIVFPPYYPKVEFRNQKGNFKVKINKILRKSLPNIDAAKVAHLGFKHIQTLFQLDQYLEQIALNARIEYARFIFRRDFLNLLLPAMEVTFSEQQIFTSQKFLFERFLEGLRNNKISLQEYLRDSGATQDSIYEELRSEAIKALKTQAFLGKLTEEANLFITEEERTFFLELLASFHKMEVEEAQQRFSKEYLEAALMDQKLMMFLMENNDREGFEQIAKEDFLYIGKPKEDSPRSSLDALHREEKTLFSLFQKQNSNQSQKVD